MAALTANKSVQTKHSNLSPKLKMPVASAATIYKGSLVNNNTSGYAQAAADTASEMFLGISTEYVDNSGGGNGAKYVTVEVGIVALMTFGTAGAITDIGSFCYVQDSNLVDLAANVTHNVVCGKILKYVSTTTFWCWVGGNPSLPAQLGTGDIADNAVTNAKMADDAIDTAELADGAVDADRLDSDAVITVKILDANVTLAKLAAQSVDPTKLVKKGAESITGAAFVSYWVEMQSEAGASSFSYTCPFNLRAIDFKAFATATKVAATATLTDNDDNDISDALSIATDGDYKRATTWDDANIDEAAANVLKVAENDNDDSCLSYIQVCQIT